MYQFSGFTTSTAFTSNVPGQVSTLGELSKSAATYTREMGIYGDVAYPEVRLLSFQSKEDGEEVELHPTRKALILELSQWLVTQSIAGSLSDNEEQCRLAIIAEFSDRLTLTTVNPMVNSGIYWLPSSIVFTIDDGEDNNCKVWFSDPAFRAQYDGYEIFVVDPIDNLDDFHTAPSIIVPMIKAIKVSDITQRVEALAGDKPYTLLQAREFDWVDKNDPENKHPVPWSVIIYGAAGINDDLIKIALQDHILANSTYTREEWEVVFPDIFLPTEFYLAPLWYRYSLPEGMMASGLYSPTVLQREVIPYALAVMPGYDQAHLENQVSVVSSVYKSIAFLACGHPRNRNGIQNFLEMWPEYANISTTHIDFNRLSPSTQNFIATLISLFSVAEKMDEFSDIPNGMTRVMRDEKWYLSRTFEQVQYLVPWKSNNIPAP